MIRSLAERTRRLDGYEGFEAFTVGRRGYAEGMNSTALAECPGATTQGIGIVAKLPRRPPQIQPRRLNHVNMPDAIARQTSQNTGYDQVQWFSGIGMFMP
jgi:hypothetical protein